MSSHNSLRGLISSAVRGGMPAPFSLKPAQAPVLDGVVEQPPLPVPTEPVLDAAAIAAAAEAAKNQSRPVFDDTSDPGSNYADTDISLKAVAAVQEWAETDDLDEGEGSADRLIALLIGIADPDDEDELSDDEADVVELAANTAWDYMSDKGVSDDDLDALLNDEDNEVGSRVQELIASKLPDGDEAAADEMDSFVFGDGSDEAALDSTVLDATYKKKIVVRKGKKVRINKRVAGRVRLSAKQKLAVRKMLRKSHGAKATMRRAKSNRVRNQMGLNK